MNVSTTFSGKTIGLRDVCLVNVRGDCSTESVLAFFNYSETVLDSTADAAIPAAISAVGQVDCCGLSAVITPEVIMGSVTKDSSSRVVQSVGAYRISLAFHNNLITKTDGSEPEDPKANAIERAIEREVRAFDARSSPAPPTVHTSVFTLEAFERASGDAINSDSSLVSVSLP